MSVQIPEFHKGPHPALKYGYAGANSVDFTDSITMEVNGVENGSVYLTAESAEYLLYSLLNAGVKVPDEFASEVKA
jgi:hypothetical protein